MQNTYKYLDKLYVYDKTGILSGNLKTLTSSDYHRV